jgi:hypothetical protein
MSKYRIVLDYGHGGSKPGAVAGGIEERHVNLMTGKALYDALHEQKGGKALQVLLTRDADYDIPLSTRFLRSWFSSGAGCRSGCCPGGETGRHFGARSRREGHRSAGPKAGDPA